MQASGLTHLFFFNEFVFKLSKLWVPTTTKGDEHHLRWGTTRTTAQTPGNTPPDVRNDLTRQHHKARGQALQHSQSERLSQKTLRRDCQLQPKILCHTRNSSRSSPSFAPSQKHTRNAAPSQEFANRNHTRNSSRSSPSFAPSQKPADHRHTRNAAPSKKFANRNHTRNVRILQSLESTLCSFAEACISQAHQERCAFAEVCES